MFIPFVSFSPNPDLAYRIHLPANNLAVQQMPATKVFVCYVRPKDAIAAQLVIKNSLMEILLNNILKRKITPQLLDEANSLTDDYFAKLRRDGGIYY